MNLTLPPLENPLGSPSKNELLDWTLQYATKFLSLSTTDEKIKFIQNIFHIQENDYNYNHISTFLIDFHLGNAVFCADSNFNAQQTFFVCKSLSTLLDDAVVASNDNPDLDYDSLRDQLAHKFQFLFKISQPQFTVQETKSILSFISSTFLRPLRLILLQFQGQPYYTRFIDRKKVFHPPIPDPLSEFTEQPVISRYDFPISYVSSDPKQIMKDFEKYETQMKDIAEKRLNELQKRIDELTAELDNQ